MTDLIAFVRLLINDPSSAANPSFTDEEIQSRLDMNCLRIKARNVDSEGTLQTNGFYKWIEFDAPLGFWETDVVLQRFEGTIVTPDVANYMTGVFTFTNGLNVDELRITGQTYNVYGAAASLMQTMISSMRAQFSAFSVDGLNVQNLYRASDMQKEVSALSAKAWGWGWPGEGHAAQIRLNRDDIRG